MSDRLKKDVDADADADAHAHASSSTSRRFYGGFGDWVVAVSDQGGPGEWFAI